MDKLKKKIHNSKNKNKWNKFSLQLLKVKNSHKKWSKMLLLKLKINLKMMKNSKNLNKKILILNLKKKLMILQIQSQFLHNKEKILLLQFLLIKNCHKKSFNLNKIRPILKKKLHPKIINKLKNNNKLQINRQTMKELNFQSKATIKNL